MRQYNICFPKKVFAGENALSNIKNIVEKEGKKVAIFCDKGVEQAGIVRYNGGYDDGQGICIHS